MDAGGGLGDDAALEALRDVLAALSATAPRLVFKKTLNRADVDPNQARLLIPCRKRGVITDADALAAFLTAEEKDIVRDDGSYPDEGRRRGCRCRPTTGTAGGST
ncbi:hypothetical protein BDA96_09G130600 [Sorghum bicolor]|uniref:Uncharacterized protein n=1 Tax=Sorghum bicolor TaxID=4558 RepID=A0A921QA65_SORBI|nr:hypothetical protein BDA96_09G130600 [Sorghum bicolor]